METATSFTSREYDFVVIGGGTAGLAVATRLAEDKSITVGVLEAGKDRSNDPRILTPGLCGTLCGDPDYGWKFVTTPQESLNGRQISWPRGRVLGGTSAINFMMVTYPSAREIDDWEALGNKGWSWKDLEPYYRRSETFIKPSDEVSIHSGTSHYDHSKYTEQGPIKVSFYKAASPLQRAWIESFEALGHRMNTDPLSGDAIGGFTNPASVDPTSMTRSYSANAYLSPNSARSNLFVLTGAHVQKIYLSSTLSSTGTLTANAVSFKQDGKEYMVQVRREVILSAGAIQSPQILELSGIGSRSVLESHNTEILIENSNVGENLQDHALISISYEVADGNMSLDALRDPALVSEALNAYTKSQVGPFAAGLEASAFVPWTPLLSGEEIKINLMEENNSHIVEDPSTGTYAQHTLLRKALLDRNLAVSQVMLAPFQLHGASAHGQQEFLRPSSPGSYMTFAAQTARPFSRGYVHIQSSEASSSPEINPRYLSHPMDIEILCRQIRNICTLASTEPLASKLLRDGRTIPAEFSRSPSLDQMKKIIQETLTTQYHPVGTCAMLPLMIGKAYSLTSLNHKPII
ncbi:aryl-alcohol dehydrogenase [Xylogone sp. PMI_703]|nr:aryl-alcohol dehydrogenase [Xylogone sp. PMI_703]